ncbi:hypothetical protein G9A89_011565 [Geosiphon pyriformis]|nr:hypothetical protein G9A89_011565 [Geosiphon pyriformis]
MNHGDALPDNLEQRILNLISQVFESTFESSDFLTRLQAIKAAFFKRDYNQIFKDPENLSIYSAKYVPTRSLCYYNLIKNEEKIFELINNRETRIFSVGSGAGSELLGFAAALNHANKTANSTHTRLHLYMQDYVNWGTILDSLESKIREQLEIKVDTLKCVFMVSDVLEPTKELQQQFAMADLITFMFVMNELFVNKKAAIEMIQLLAKNMRKGTHLLIVDSAGSFSNLNVGGKTYMIYFLLDALKEFDVVVSHDSVWYRYPENLKYPQIAPLENMRHFIRLYCKNC